MADFPKFQTYKIAHDEIVISFGLYFCMCFMLFWGPLYYAFILSFKLQTL